MIHVSEAQNDDYAGFCSVFKEVEELHRLEAPWKFQRPEDGLFSKEYFMQLINDKDCLFLIAKDGTETAGYSIAFKKATSGIPILKYREFIYIEDLAVISTHRKKNIGSLLMEKIEEAAKNDQITELELNVWLFNENAINFYRKRGYEAITQKMRKSI